MSNYKWLYDKYPIEQEVFEIDDGNGGIKELYKFYTPEFPLHTVLFQKNENNSTFEPAVYNVEYYDNGEVGGDNIEEGSIIYAWIQSVKNVLQSVDVNTKKITEGSLFLYQWVSTIHLLITGQKLDSTIFDKEQSRQTGKNFELELLCGVLVVFGKKYFSKVNEKFWVILCSYKLEDGVDKVFNNVYKHMEKNIELFNILYRDTPIFKNKFEWQGQSYVTVDKYSSQKVEINII